MALLAGLALGLGGSIHCAGMCGPLMLALGGGSSGTRFERTRRSTLYQLGRILTYVALGLATGLVGEALATRGFGRALAIAAGLLLLAAAARSIRALPLGGVERLGASAATRACVAAGRWSAAHPAAGPLLTGAANGLLPCGLVYAALTTAAALGRTVDAALLMAGFGVGTLPVLAILLVSATSVPAAVRLRLRRLMPLALALTGVLLIVRGLAPAAPAAHAHPPAHVGHAAH